MSVLDICPTMESTKPRYRYHHHHHHRQSSTTASYDTISTTSSRNSSFEVLFSRLLDALIFTSAIAITAYSYLTGTLIDKPAALIVENKPLVTYTPKRNLVLDPIEDAKRKRTQQWAEDQLQIPTVQLKKRSYSTGKVQPLVNNMKREKKRTQSLPKIEIDSDKDEKLSRMEEQIQSLLEEGQNALLNPIAL